METVPQPIACSVCLHDVPISEDASAEARDYIAHFFGLACYSQWSHQENQVVDDQPEAKAH